MPQPRIHASAAARQAAYRARCDEARRATLAAKGLPFLPTLACMPGTARWNASLTMARELTAETLSEMQDYFDDRSESWQESERGQEHQERMGSIEAVLDALEELVP